MFHLGSLYLAYEDIKNKSITLWVLIFTLIMGGISALPIAFTIEVLISNILFFAVVISLIFIKKSQVIAWADIFYIFVILLLIQDLWWLFFICIGLISLIFHYGNNKGKELPFIAVLYGAFIATKLCILLQ
ncbi:MAG TPA: hypothetical protein DIC42_07160 [Holosporales bacterium]|nr:hypothetical protein [Holosporales bacterium]